MKKKIHVIAVLVISCGCVCSPDASYSENIGRVCGQSSVISFNYELKAMFVKIPRDVF